MVYFIRKMIEDDITKLYKEFEYQNWNKPIEIFERYYNEQNNNIRKVFIAYYKNQIFGYATLLDNADSGAFKNMNIPIIIDFNVFERYQKNGIGNGILEYIENDVKNYSNKICLGVGLHSGYGKAQRLYAKRNYIPDGSGVWYQDNVLEPYTNCINDDNLILYLIKYL